MSVFKHCPDAVSQIRLARERATQTERQTNSETDGQGERGGRGGRQALF